MPIEILTGAFSKLLPVLLIALIGFVLLVFLSKSALQNQRHQRAAPTHT